MPSWPYLLRSGKRLVLPSLFVRPSTAGEAEIVYKMFSDYPNETDQIAGFVSSMKDWPTLAPILSDNVPRIKPDTEYFKQKIRVIDPDIHILFTGFKIAKRALMEVPLDNTTLGDITIPGVMGPVPFKRMVEAAIGEVESNKAQNYADRFYSHIGCITHSIEKFQIDNNMDIIIGNYVPITSLSLATRQIEELRHLTRDSIEMFRGVFTTASRVKDFMAMIAVNANILASDHSEEIVELAANCGADHLGLKLLNFDDKDPARASAVLRFIEDLRSIFDEQKKSTPIHLFNVMSEFAYAAFCHGATSGFAPLATIPELHFDPNNPVSPELKGRYYHPIDLTYDTYEELCAKTQTNNFALPCSCPTCRDYGTVIRAVLRWPSLRKEHWIFDKNEEMGEIRAVPSSTLNIHLKDKFARSQATSYLPYFDYMYPYIEV